MILKLLLGVGLVAVVWWGWSNFTGGEANVSGKCELSQLQLEGIREETDALREERPPVDDPRLVAHEKAFGEIKIRVRYYC